MTESLNQLAQVVAEICDKCNSFLFVFEEQEDEFQIKRVAIFHQTVWNSDVYRIKFAWEFIRLISWESLHPLDSSFWSSSVFV